MRFLLKISKSAIYALLLAFVLMTSVLVFLVTTTPGVYLTIKLIRAWIPGQIQVQKANGSLSGTLSIHQLTYQHNGLLIQGQDVTLHCSLRQLLFHHRLVFSPLNARQLLIQPPAVASTTLTQVQMKATLSNHHWQISRFNFNYAGHAMQGTARAKPLLPYPINARIDIKPLQKKQGLTGSLSLTGNLAAYHWQGQLLTAGSGHIQIKGALNQASDLDTRLQWQNFRWPLPGMKSPLSSPRGQVVIRGTIPHLILQADADMAGPLHGHLALKATTQSGQAFHSEGTLTLPNHLLRVTGQYNGNQPAPIQGHLSAQSRGDEASEWPLQHVKAEASIQGKSLSQLSATGMLTAEYNNTPLKVTVNYQSPSLTSHISLAQNHLTITGSPSSSWQAEATLPNPDMLHPALRDLKTTLSLKAVLKQANQGHLVLHIGKGYYQDPELKPLPFEGGEISAKLNNHDLKAKGQFIIDPNKSARLNLTLPQFQWQHLLDQHQAVQGELTVQINSLDFLEELNGALTHPAGQLQAHLRASGLLHRPVLQGQLTLSHGRADLPQWGIAIDPVNLTLETHDRQWTIHGALFSGNHPLQIEGQGQFSPTLVGSIALHGENIPILNLDEYKMDLSPKLMFQFKPASYVLTGNLLVPKALIKPHNFESSASLSGDVVFTGQHQAEPNPLHLDSNVSLTMGQDVAIAIKGLKGYLDGSLQLRQLPSEPMRATGELTVRDGQYRAYGQDLLIQQGQLIYTGSLIDNPDIKVRAIRQFNNASASFAGSNRLFDFDTENLQSYDFGNKTTVGIDVSGHLSTPKTQLFSIPSNLSQADILSMLLLGKPASQASKSGGQLLLAAISSMNLDSGSKGTQLLQQLKNSLGFDLNVENNTEYNRKTNETTDTTSFVVGKSLSNRLYLSYNMGFSQGSSNLLTLKYLLNKFFSIQVSASMSGSSGVDLLYTHQKD